MSLLTAGCEASFVSTPVVLFVIISSPERGEAAELRDDSVLLQHALWYTGHLVFIVQLSRNMLWYLIFGGFVRHKMEITWLCIRS